MDAVLQATTTSVLSQDAITTSAILVDADSPSPVASFHNPNAAGISGNAQIEALAVVNGTLAHVKRNLATDSGWEATSLFDNQSALEVAAGTAYAASSSAQPYGFFHDGITLHWTQLESDGATWSTPSALPTLATNLNVAYSPAGQVILYGSTAAGALLLGYQDSIGGSFQTSICTLDSVLDAGDFSLCMTDEETWWLASNSSGTPIISRGTLGAAAPETSAPVTQLQNDLQHVALAYNAAQQNTLMFLFVDSSSALQVWALSAQNVDPVIQPIPNTSVSSATGYVDQNGALHVYSRDASNTLWVLHQNSTQPWNSDGTPAWATIIALDTQIAGIVSDMNPADAPTLFALDAADASLRLHTQDPTTQMWTSGPLQQAAATVSEVTRFRTEVSIFDQYANPLPNQAVTVQVAPGGSAVDLWVGGTIYPVDANTPVQLTTDAYGKLTLASLTTATMAAPNLVLNADGLATPLQLLPAGPIHTYLSGTGTLNPTNPSGALPTFDSAGDTLTAATVGGTSQPLAPNTQGNPALAAVAAQAIQSTALVGLNQTPAGVIGYKVNVADPNTPTYQTITSTDDLRAHVEALRGSLVGSFWSDLEHWAGDIWEGIKNGVATITSIVVDAVNKVATLAINIGKVFAQGVSIAINGIEQAAHAIAGFFQVIAAGIEDVIDWLKALFDFGAIWRTKMAIEQAILGLPPVIKQLVGYASNDIEGWFKSKEGDINSAIDTLAAKYSGQTVAQLPHFQQPGNPPDATTPVAGQATTADFNNNVHHNWWQDKMSAYAPAASPVTPASTLVSPWQNFVSSAQTSGEDFVSALQDFANAVNILATDPLQIGTLGIADFLNAIKNLVDSALSLCDALAQGFLSMCEGAIDVLVDMLTTSLNLGPLNLLWAWIAEAAGYPADTNLTLSALLALLAAFPCTVIYKLVEGVSNEPFPDGQLPQPTAALPIGATGGLFQDMPFGCRLSASILQILYVIPAGIGDYIGNSAPWYFTAATVALTATMFVLNNGIPQLTQEEWGLVFQTASGILISLPILGFLLNAFQDQLAKLGALIQQASGDIMNMVFTAYGVVRFLFDVYAWAADDTPVLSGVASLLLPIPSAFAFLRMSAFRDEPEWAPIFQVASVIMDAIGYVGGGICQMVYVITSDSDDTTLALRPAA